MTKYLPPFEVFRKNVIFHIPHKYSTEITTKSETVSPLMYHPFPYTGGGGGGTGIKGLCVLLWRVWLSICSGKGWQNAGELAQV